MMEYDNFTQSWRGFQQSNQALHNWGESLMQRYLPADQSHELYWAGRTRAQRGLELSTFFIGAATAAPKLVTAVDYSRRLFSRGRQNILPRSIPQMGKAVAKENIRFRGAQWKFLKSSSITNLESDAKIANVVQLEKRMSIPESVKDLEFQKA
jgi:hypothetical protein